MDNLNAHEFKIIKELLQRERDHLIESRYRQQVGKGDPDIARKFTIRINELENILLKI